MNLCPIMLLPLVATRLPLSAQAEILADSREFSGTVATTISTHADLIYVRPTTKMKIHSYSLLGYAAGNVALEFLYSGPHHALLHRMHLDNGHAAANAGSTP